MPITEVALNVDAGFFYDRLAPYGDWVADPAWGWVWIPRGMSVDWRPYTLGHWVYTDDYGWLWDSDQPWGWVCFHYGRWGWNNYLGWYWVPGSTWGPAWVAWRVGPDSIGWAPLPPEVRWQPDVGLEYYGFNENDIPVPLWVFVETRFFDAPRLREHVFLPGRNVTLFGESRNVTRFRSRDGRVVNASISPQQVEESTHRPVERFHVRHADNAAALRLPRERDGEITVFTPQVRPGRAEAMPPRTGEIERRQQAERSQLQEQQQAEQAHQEQRHRAERTQIQGRPGGEHVAAGGAAEQLQRRQEAERQTLQGEHQRQRQMLENRQRHEREAVRGPEARANEPSRGTATRNEAFGGPSGGPVAQAPEPRERGPRR